MEPDHHGAAGAGEGAGDGGAAVALAEAVVGYFHPVVTTLSIKSLKCEHNPVTISCYELPFLQSVG